MRLFILGLIGLFLVDGCAACKDAPANTTLKCIVVNDIIDCSTSNVLSAAPAFEPLLNWVIGLVAATTVPINWPGLAASLISAGIQDVGCFFAELDKTLPTIIANPASLPAGASPEFLAKVARQKQIVSDFQAFYGPWRAAHYPPRVDEKGVVHPVKFRLRDGSTR